MEKLVGKIFKGKDYPIYKITKCNEYFVILCEWENGSVSGFADEKEVLNQIKNGKIRELTNSD